MKPDCRSQTQQELRAFRHEQERLHPRWHGVVGCLLMLCGPLAWALLLWWIWSR